MRGTVLLSLLYYCSLCSIGHAEVSIMPLGDSITVGYQGAPAGSYRQELQTILNDAGIDHDFVGDFRKGSFSDPDHQGTTGYTIDDMIVAYGPSIRAHNPDIVLVLAGTNNHWQSPVVSEFETRYQSLVDLIRTNAPASKIILSMVPKFGYDPSESSYWTDEWVDNRNENIFPVMNAAISLVAAVNPNTTVVDFHSAIDVQTDLASDAVHLNLNGQQKLARLFGDEIIRLNSVTIPEPSMLAFPASMFVLFTSRHRRKIRRTRPIPAVAASD